MQPVVEAFRHGWTDADTFSVLDDALSTDLARAGTLNAALKRRSPPSPSMSQALA